MIRLLHAVVVGVYAILPVAALAAAVVRRARRDSPDARPRSVADARAEAVVRFVLTCISGTAMGVTLCLVYARATGGKTIWSQVALASYFGTGLLLLLKGLDRVLRAGIPRLLRVRRDRAGKAVDPRAERSELAFVLRVLMLFGLGLPYVMAAVMTYRPKVGPGDDPMSELRAPFERVWFNSTDGLRLSGWWIPALPQRSASRSSVGSKDWGKKTVIVCHGLAASKSNHLTLAKDLVPNGYNVLIFDFRAHGESGGQLTTFGDLERRDVLGAVRWVRANKAGESKRLLGLGVSMGAAALIAAAADDSPEGKAIDAVAVYGTYDALGPLVKTMADSYFVPPVNWLAVHVGLPLASVQTGRDLAAFSPAAEIGKLWPRPVLVIHGVADGTIDFNRGEALYEAASPPKYNYWVTGAGHNDVIENPNASKAVRVFFETAEPVPVI